MLISIIKRLPINEWRLDRGEEMESKNEVKGAATSASVQKGAMRLALLATAGLLLIEPSIAAAAPWDDAVRAIADTLTGTLGRTIAIIAVIVLGLMAMAGKLEWMNAIKVVVGIVIMFSAGQIINWIAPQAGLVTRVAANSAAECAARNSVWVPVSVEISDAQGILFPAEAAYCVDAQYAMSACTSTRKTSVAPAAVGARATATYYTYVAAAATCS